MRVCGVYVALSHLYTLNRKSWLDTISPRGNIYGYRVSKQGGWGQHIYRVRFGSNINKGKRKEGGNRLKRKDKDWQHVG